MSATWWRTSASEVDTLSWLTSSLAAASVTVVIALSGATAIGWGGQAGNRPLLQLLAVVSMCIAVILVQSGARPARARFATGRAATVYALVSVAVMVSSAGYTDLPALAPQANRALSAILPVTASSFDVNLWWTPVCAALVLMVSSPFVPGRVYVLGASAVALSTGMAVTVVALASGTPFAGATSLIATSTVIFALIGGVMLTRTFIGSVEEWRAREPSAVRADIDDEAVVAVIDRMTESRFSTLVVPFLERIENAETVTPADRRRAAQLAADVRSALVTRGDQSWLAAHMAGRPIFVADPMRLAETITVDQRAAIIALVDGLFSDSEAGVFGARLDLAPAEDDAVAVAVTVGLSLPEGRRTSVLAPYYLTVKSVVRRIEWKGGESLVVTFDVDSDR